MNTQISAISIANTQIREVNGLFSLADLHKASGGLKKHQPALWLRGSQTTDFIDELTTLQIRRVKEKQGVSEEAKQALLEDESSLRERIIKTVNGGNNRGTFVCKELVVHYGMWISPAFSIQVIQTFLNSKQAPQPQLPTPRYPALTEQDKKDLPAPLGAYVFKLTGWLAKSKGVPQSQIEQQVIEQCKGDSDKGLIHQPLYIFSRAAAWLHDELDKLPVVDFGVCRDDLLNIFKRQCAYKQDFENWNDYQLKSWLDERFFRNRQGGFVGYPTSLESASYKQLEKLVDEMKRELGKDFKLLDLSQQPKQTAALPKLCTSDGSIGQVLFDYGAKNPRGGDVALALQDMALLRSTFDHLTYVNYDSDRLNKKEMAQVAEAGKILNGLSVMLMEAASETLKH